MDIRISSGQWVTAITDAMLQACDGDCFLLPSNAHLHAYEIAKHNTKQEKTFKVKIQP